MASEVAPDFGALLRRHRLAAGWSQEELAEAAGLSARAVTALERGERRAPHRDTVRLLADALRLPPDERFLILFDLIASGAALLEDSPHREASSRLRRQAEEEWQRIHKEFFAHHGG